MCFSNLAISQCCTINKISFRALYPDKATGSQCCGNLGDRGGRINMVRLSARSSQIRYFQGVPGRLCWRCKLWRRHILWDWHHDTHWVTVIFMYIRHFHIIRHFSHSPLLQCIYRHDCYLLLYYLNNQDNIYLRVIKFYILQESEWSRVRRKSRGSHLRWLDSSNVSVYNGRGRACPVLACTFLSFVRRSWGSRIGLGHV